MARCISARPVGARITATRLEVLSGLEAGQHWPPIRSDAVREGVKVKPVVQRRRRRPSGSRISRCTTILSVLLAGVAVCPDRASPHVPGGEFRYTRSACMEADARRELSTFRCRTRSRSPSRQSRYRAAAVRDGGVAENGLAARQGGVVVTRGLTSRCRITGGAWRPLSARWVTSPAASGRASAGSSGDNECARAGRCSASPRRIFSVQGTIAQSTGTLVPISIRRSSAIELDASDHAATNVVTTGTPSLS